MWRVGDTLGGGNIGHCFDLDGTDEESLTRALIWGRKSMREYEKYYKNYLKGYERMELVATGSLLGVRETRRITGDYVLRLPDFKRRASFEDEIGRNAYSVDIHVAKPDKVSFAKFLKVFTTLRFKEGKNFGIPYRTLTPRGLRNVLVAGRCISTDRFLQSSIRIMPCCFVTGQAAGLAAAQAIRSKTADVHALDVPKLRRALKRMGAYLPEKTAA